MSGIFKELKNYRRESILAPLLKLAEAGLELIVPLVVADIIDKGIGANSGKEYIIGRCLILLLLGILGLALSVTAQYFAAKAAVGVATDMRSKMFARIGTLSFADLDRIGAPTLITRMTSDINQVQTGINMSLRLLLRAPVIVFGAMIMAFTIDVKGALIFAAVTVVLFIIVFAVMAITLPKYKEVQSKLDNVLAKTRENLSGSRVIRAFRREDAEISEFNAENFSLAASQIKAGKISSVLNPATYAVINIAIIILIKSGAVRVNAGLLTQGAVVALYNYMLQILVELIKLANLIITITRSVASGSRVFGVFDTSSAVEDDFGAGYTEGTDSAEAVRFDSVSFSYGGSGDDVLRNISFCIKKGSTFGIIGGTGSGKSTLISLIPRFYSAVSGKVSVFGRDVTEYDAEALRSKVAVVMQKPVLFKGTIRENLMIGASERTEAELLDALHTACGDDILEVKENGLDSAVEQNGRNFSGGQKQRLTIARALINKPEILILDDSTSALDFSTEAKLRENISHLEDKPTVITVSQRTSSVMHCDSILVMDDGKAVGFGTHSELMKNCDLYKEIYASQFGTEASDNE